MKRNSLLFGPLLAVALIAQTAYLPAQADVAVGSAAGTASASGSAAFALPIPGSAQDRNLTDWISQVESDPNKFDQNLEEDCVETGGAACELSYSQIRRIPGEIKDLTTSLLAEVQGDPKLDAEVTADFAVPSPQTRSFGSAAKGVLAVIKGSSSKAVQALAGNADAIGKVTDNVSRLAYANLGAQGAVQSGSPAPIAKVAIYSMPIIGDVFSLGEAILDTTMTPAERVESGVVATISLIGTVAAFAGGPVGAAVGAAVGIGLAAYYTVKAIWGWFAGGSEDWTVVPPTTPEDLFKNGAFLEWETQRLQIKSKDISSGKDTTTPKDIALVVPLTAKKQVGTVSQTLLLDSRWTDYNRTGQPVSYTIRPLSSADKSGQGLVSLSTWGGQSATFTAWQDGVKYGSDPCRTRQEVTFGFIGYTAFDCTPPKSLTIAKDHPMVIKITFTYKLPRSCSPRPCIPQNGSVAGAGLEVYTDKGENVYLSLPFGFAVVNKTSGKAAGATGAAVSTS